MAIPTWPSELPQKVLSDGYNETVSEDRLFGNVDIGSPKSRFKGLGDREVDVSFVVSAAQRARLDRFYREDTARRTKPFKIPDQVYNGLALADTGFSELTDDAGDTLTGAYFWLAQFKDRPNYTPFGLGFLARFTLLLYPTY